MYLETGKDGCGLVRVLVKEDTDMKETGTCQEVHVALPIVFLNGKSLGMSCI